MSKSMEHIETLTEIKKIMDRSSKFISLSGFSGIYIGLIAIIGVLLPFYIFDLPIYNSSYISLLNTNSDLSKNFFNFFLLDALFMLLISVSLGILFTSRKATRLKLPVWNKQALYLIINLIIPLVAGGVICLLLLTRNIFDLILPFTMVFYGLALVNASKFTFNDLKYFGIIETSLGLISCFFIQYSLIFWILGFGVLHIVYGIVMYFKYERMDLKNFKKSM